MQSRNAVKKLFDEIAPRFKDRAGGYTRVVKFGVRRGDAAPLSIIEFTGTSEKAEAKKPRKKKMARRDAGVESRRVAAAGYAGEQGSGRAQAGTYERLETRFIGRSRISF